MAIIRSLHNISWFSQPRGLKQGVSIIRQRCKIWKYWESPWLFIVFPDSLNHVAMIRSLHFLQQLRFWKKSMSLSLHNISLFSQPCGQREESTYSVNNQDSNVIYLSESSLYYFLLSTTWPKQGVSIFRDLSLPIMLYGRHPEARVQFPAWEYPFSFKFPYLKKALDFSSEQPSPYIPGSKS